jgi:hypothetical protein
VSPIQKLTLTCSLEYQALRPEKGDLVGKTAVAKPARPR